MSEWTLAYDHFAPAAQPLREALCALGNGYFVTRGAAEEARAGGVHYPGTYLAGGYDRAVSEIGGRLVENEDLVNWPSWLPLSFRIEDGEWLDLGVQQVVSFDQRLHMEEGVLERVVTVRDRRGRETSLDSRRLVHMGMPHLAAIEWELRPRNWSGRLEIRSGLDGRVENAGVARYRALERRHVAVRELGQAGEDEVWLVAESLQSRLRVALAARTVVVPFEDRGAVERHTETEGAWAGQRVSVDAERGRPVRVEKTVALYTSRDWAISEPRLEACRAVREAPSFSALRESHARAWARLWRRCDIRLRPGGEVLRNVRLHLFHLLQTTSPSTIDLDVGVPARGWHGEAYRGHVFWDELFVFPLLNLRLPEITRALLSYRYRRLPQARRLAREAGLAGASFPWQSGSDGREESQRVHLNPRSGRWLPDHTLLQRHVSAAVAYNVWTYFQVTRDLEFLEFYGAEIILDVARMLASLAHYDAAEDRYGIRGVVGPDEFHVRYPGADEPGLEDNAYTNVMAVWVLRQAQSVLALLPPARRAELCAELGLCDDDAARWREIAHKMRVAFHPGPGGDVISQFSGYEALEELDWEGYRARYGDIHRLDRLLEAEGDDVNCYKASKQADALMLLYLLPVDELGRIFAALGYRLDADLIGRTIEYYSKRTSHGSTLSAMVHSWVLARWDRARSFGYFERALRADVDDVQGGTTAEGIHLGAMAGTVDLAQRCYTGLELRGDVLHFDPRLPDAIERISMRLHYRSHDLDVEVTQDRLTVTCVHAWYGDPLELGFRGRTYTLCQGEVRRLELDRAATS